MRRTHASAKQILGIVMTVAMLIGMLPFYAMATDYPNIAPDQEMTVTLDGDTVTDAICKFVPETDGTYVFWSYNNDHDTYGHLLDSNLEELNHNDGGEGTNFRVEYTMTAGTTYYLKSRFYSTYNSGSFKFKLTKAAPATSLAITEDAEITVNAGIRNTLYYEFTPTNYIAEEVTFASDNTSVVSLEGNRFYALKAGTTTVTVTSDSGLTYTGTLTVEDYENILLDKSYYFTPNASVNGEYYRFIPAEDGTYSFASTGSLDPYGCLYYAAIEGTGDYSGTQYVIFKIVRTYVYVGGVQVYNGEYLANGETETTKEKPNGGYAYYADGVLTLNNFEYEGEGYWYDTEGGYSAVIYGIDILTINIVGTNAITNTAESCDGIVSNGNITLSGNGKLTVTSDYGIYCHGTKVNVNECNLILNSYRTGIYSENDITVNSGSVQINAKNGMHCYGIINVNSGHVEITVDRIAVKAGEINIADGAVAQNAILTDMTYGDANADGKINLSDASLILQYIAGWDVTLGK